MNSLLPNTDNFFKYLLTIGLAFLFFALIYPLKKEQQLRLAQIDLLNQSTQLNYEIKAMRTVVDELDEYRAQIQLQINRIDSLQRKSPNKDSLGLQRQKNELKAQFDSKKEQLAPKIDALNLKNIANDFAIQKHEELASQIWEYTVFKAIFWIAGILCSLLGFTFWMGTVYMDEQIKGLQIANGYQSIYIKTVEFLKRDFMKIILVLVLILSCLFLCAIILI